MKSTPKPYAMLKITLPFVFKGLQWFTLLSSGSLIIPNCDLRIELLKVRFI
jgi:hypothetical protein